MEINAPNVVLKLQKIPTLGRGRRKQFYVILLQEVPENAHNVVQNANASYSRRGFGLPPRTTPAWSLHSHAADASLHHFSYISLHEILCSPGEKFLSPPLEEVED